MTTKTTKTTKKVRLPNILEIQESRMNRELPPRLRHNSPHDVIVKLRRANEFLAEAHLDYSEDSSMTVETRSVLIALEMTLAQIGAAIGLIFDLDISGPLEEWQKKFDARKETETK